tara:strand:+ start:302 stop:532 length:231 start_codon:yes stop_codon:yes gene_type:complete
MKLNEFEDRIDELERDKEQLLDRVSDLEDMVDKLLTFAKPCAIGQDQLWEILEHESEKGNIETFIPSGGLSLEALV